MRSPLLSLVVSAALALGGGLGLAACGETTYGFDEVGTGSDGQNDVPRAKTSSQFLRGAYADLLGRAPTSYTFEIVDGQGNQLVAFPIDEQAQLLDTLDAVGDPAPLRNLIVVGLLDHVEGDVPDKGEVSDPAGWIAEQFTRFLGRAPNAYELAAFVEAWDSDPAVGPRTIIRAIMSSREYQSF